MPAKHQLQFLNSLEHLNTMGGKHNTHVNDFILMGPTDSEAIQRMLFMLFLLIYLVTVLGNAGMIWIIHLSLQLHIPKYFFSSATCHYLISVTQKSSHLKLKRTYWFPPSTFHTWTASPRCISCLLGCHWMCSSLLHGIWLLCSYLQFSPLSCCYVHKMLLLPSFLDLIWLASWTPLTMCFAWADWISAMQCNPSLLLWQIPNFNLVLYWHTRHGNNGIHYSWLHSNGNSYHNTSVLCVYHVYYPGNYFYLSKEKAFSTCAFHLLGATII